jgi:hypothetical protein
VGDIFLGAMLFGRVAHILHEKLNGLFSYARTNAVNVTGSFGRAERRVRAWSVQCVVIIRSNR